eukprot:TRINITY_DN9553_c0_g1_i1.p1 TRINITY_DN9553_c0_g1~~TRINITY_DN9553_c0_g1_i1.p1  ORF type:complete len:377 (+),score=66.49 TRINITY_DN9553_c0_g1_i1:25-1131(+)
MEASDGGEAMEVGSPKANSELGSPKAMEMGSPSAGKNETYYEGWGKEGSDWWYTIQCDACRKVLSSRLSYWSCVECPEDSPVDMCDKCALKNIWKSKQHPRTHRLQRVVQTDDPDINLRADATSMDNRALELEIVKCKAEINRIEKLLENTTAESEEKENEEDTMLEVEAFDIPEHCVPIRTDVRVFDFDALAKEVQFDVIMMDPPWLLATSTPTRGVALGYKQLPNNDIQNIPVPKLQKNGFLFIWVINARYSFALDMMKEWGYTFVDDITWVKSTVNRRLAKGHGFYLQHAKETCLVGVKGPVDDMGRVRRCLESDVIFAERRGQSQKPEQIYELVEALVPNGKYLEIFARRNNLRNYWVSIGLEL